MQAIYEAILQIPHSPSEATKRLCKLARTQPLFLQHLKTMALQLHDRYAPTNQEEQTQYQTICKQLLAIYNRFVNVSFQQKGNDIYLSIESYYQWTIQLLLCQRINLTAKKSMVSSFTQVINSICYEPTRMAELVDYMMEHSNRSSSIFVYLECLLSSNVHQSKIIQSIKRCHQFLFYVAISEYEQLINFYKNTLMEIDIGQILPNANFLQKLKQNEYILFQIHKMFKLFEKIYQKSANYAGFMQLASQMFFNVDFARYLSSLLKMERDLFNFEKPNLYGLKIIIMTSLRSSEKNVINIMKSLCFSILKIILALTDKDFNLQCTDKLLMSELPNLSDLIIGELLICSQPDVMSRLSAELQITTLIASMFGLLSVIIHFRDLKQKFSTFNIQKLIRLTFFYSKTYEEEQNMYQNNPQEYFYFSYYICDKPLDKQQQIQLDIIEEFSMRQKSVQFIKSMNAKVEGFHNIVLDVCCDIIKLHFLLCQHNQMEYKLMFLEKYSLKQDIFYCFNLQSAISVFTVLLQNSWDRHEKMKRMHFLLTNIQLGKLNKLQLYRLYICLSINHSLFVLHKGHRLFHQFIEKVYELDNRICSVTHAGYYFVQRLLSQPVDGDKDYDDFAYKTLGELTATFQVAQCMYPFQTVQDVIKIDNIFENIVCLEWINHTLKILNTRIQRQVSRNHGAMFKFILKLYRSLMIAAEKKIVQNKQMPYPSFAGESTQYFQQMIAFVDPGKFRYFEKISKQKEPDDDDETIIVNFGSILLQTLIQEVPLNNEQIDLILNFTLSLLQRSERFQEPIKKIAFELLCQLIHIRIFTFDQKPHQIILTWMKENYFHSEVCLNRICVILQGLYYYIDGNINQNQANFLSFYSSIIQILEKKFLQLLFEYHNYVEALQEEIDTNIKKIKELRIKFDPSIKIKTNPITIIRLYNTILLNPYFDITIIRKIHEMIKKYNFQIIPSYDLTMQVLSLESLIKRSKNISVIECFRFTTELFGYNCKNSELKCREETEVERQIVRLTEGLRTSLTLIDPYEAYCILIDRYVFRPEQTGDYISSWIDEIEISIMNYLQNDKYLLNLVKKLTLIRKVNNKTRMIIRIRKNNE